MDFVINFEVFVEDKIIASFELNDNPFKKGEEFNISNDLFIIIDFKHYRKHYYDSDGYKNKPCIGLIVKKKEA